MHNQRVMNRYGCVIRKCLRGTGRSHAAGALRAAQPGGRIDRAGVDGPLRVSQPAVSKHLRVLKHTGLVRARHKGRQTHYRARPRGLAPLVDWMTFYSSFWEDRFTRLEDLLKRIDQ